LTGAGGGEEFEGGDAGFGCENAFADCEADAAVLWGGLGVSGGL